MTLSATHRRERGDLKNLSRSLDKNAHTLQQAMEVLVAYRDFGGGDPLPHIKQALRDYLKEEPTDDQK